MNYLADLEDLGLTPDTQDTSRTDQELLQAELQAKGIVFRVETKKKRRGYPRTWVIEEIAFVFVGYSRLAQDMSGDIRLMFSPPGRLIGLHWKMHL